MSGFHGMCSLGGLIGAMLVTALLAIGLSPLMSTLSVVMVLLVVSFVAIPSALTTFEQDEQGAAEITDAPKKIFTSEWYDPLIGVMCFIAFCQKVRQWTGVVFI